MTLEQLLAQARGTLAARIETRNTQTGTLTSLRAQITGETVSPELRGQIDAALAERSATDAEIEALQATIAGYEAEIRADAAVNTLQAEVIGTGAGARGPAYDQVARVASEERTYAPHKERGFDQSTGRFRSGAKPGSSFERDVAAAFLGDYAAQGRLARHQQEERVERDARYFERAVGTGAFAGLTVPQYLTDQYAPAAAAKRPFADAILHQPLPETGMTANISRITTSTATAVQASENSAVQETNIDDTLLTVSIQTNAGQQTMSRQSIERGTNTEAVVMDDLFRQYATKLDSTLLNQATNGLTNVATSIAYTDASPTVAELLPKFSQAASAIESTLLDLSSGELIVVMHGRRWYWLNNALVSTWPALGQPGTIVNALGMNFAETYGRGVRGILPNNLPVIVDNNIATNLGAGTNEDEVYVVDRNQCVLWEDPNAPMFIRAEQTQAASLGVLLVVYGYFGYSFARYSHTQKLAGTGLVTPAFTGV